MSCIYAQSPTTAELGASAAIAKDRSNAHATGAERVVRTLAKHGVEIIAGVPGGAALPIYDALAQYSRIRHVLARHEQAAGFIAQGIARMSRRAAVCLATSGPGVTNLLTPIADAMADSIPLVCITAQVPQHLIGTHAFQEVPTLDLARPITKAAWMVRRTSDLESVIGEAFHSAETGRTGPVWVDIPKDVLLESCAASPVRVVPRIDRLAIHEHQIAAAVELIRHAQQPVLLIGAGVVRAQAEQLLLRFAEQLQIPVAMTLFALGAIPHKHPLNLGMVGMHGALATNRAIHDCDVLIAIGTRFDDRATGDPKQLAPHARIIHVDSDARELKKIMQPTVAIHADAWKVLTTLVARIPSRRHQPEIMLGNNATGETSASQPASTSARSRAHQIIAEIGAVVSANTILTTDVGQHQMWVAQAYPFVRADRWLTSGGLGTMGFGLPAAIGAALFDPDATVVCCTGDGSLLMNIQELATLAELALNVKILLFDNGGYGLVHQQQRLFYEGRYCASVFQRRCDFVQISRSFEIAAQHLSFESQDDPCWRRQLREFLIAKGPELMCVPIDMHNMALPMVPPGCANIDAIP